MHARSWGTQRPRWPSSLPGGASSGRLGWAVVATEEIEVDGAAAAFSTWRVEKDDSLHIGDIEIDKSFYFQTGRVVLDACMTDERGARLLASLLENAFLLRINFLLADGTHLTTLFVSVVASYLCFIAKQ